MARSQLTNKNTARAVPLNTKAGKQIAKKVVAIKKDKNEEGKKVYKVRTITTRA